MKIVENRIYGAKMFEIKILFVIAANKCCPIQF